jgi:hypothetical protein
VSASMQSQKKGNTMFEVTTKDGTQANVMENHHIGKTGKATSSFMTIAEFAQKTRGIQWDVKTLSKEVKKEIRKAHDAARTTHFAQDTERTAALLASGKVFVTNKRVLTSKDGTVTGLALTLKPKKPANEVQTLRAMVAELQAKLAAVTPTIENK